jgi:hypothetical protein
MKMQTKRLLFFVLLSTWVAMASAQQTPITGTVRDNNAQGLPGATVTEKGTTNKVLTDASGNFLIKVHPKATLVISFVGFETKEVPASQEMSIVLEQLSQTLNEVVVTGFGTKKSTRKLS